MFNGLRRTVAPIVEPIQLSDAKKYLRIDHNEEDLLIQSMIQAAREECEERTKLSFITQTWTITFTKFPIGGVELPRPPMGSITSVEYRDANDSWNNFSGYSVDLLEAPCRVYLTESAPQTSNLKDAWRIVYKTGYGDDSCDVPESLKNAILLKIKALYEKEGDSKHLHDAANSILDLLKIPFLS